MVKLPTGVDIQKLIHDLRIFSWEAADILLYYSNMGQDQNNHSKLIISDKNDDLVTLADLKVNEIIIKRINENYKNIDWEILSEENVKNSTEDQNLNSDWIWVLDPLDGTRDFIQGTGNYAMHLALNYKNEPILGVVLIPEKNQLWFSNGDKGWGENRTGSYLEPELSNKETLNDMTLVTSKNHSNDFLKKLIKKINFKEVIVMGSIGCKIASILRGESDIYISVSLPENSSPKDWDFAAPLAILEAAGGVITNLENQRLVFNSSNFEQGGILIASSNANLHKAICSQIKQTVKELNDYL